MFLQYLVKNNKIQIANNKPVRTRRERIKYKKEFQNTKQVWYLLFRNWDLFENYNLGFGIYFFITKTQKTRK